MVGLRQVALAALAGLLLNPAAAQGLAVRVAPQPVDRGRPAALILSPAPSEREVKARFQGRPIPLIREGSDLIGLFGVDVMIKPGRHPLTLSWKTAAKSHRRQKIFVEVRDRDYGTRRLKVDRAQVVLSPADLARAKQEKALVKKALATYSLQRLWRGSFLRPASGEVISAFGRRTIINDQPRQKPHTGVDIRAAEGDPIKAPADGRVILAGFHFFAGGSIYLDHGLGLITMFFHLSQIEVEAGQTVARGQIIGRAGATGRVTGPHLHYGLYLDGARIDPLAFQELTETLALE